MSESNISVPLLDLRGQYSNLRTEIREVIDKICDAQTFILGPEVDAFEKEVAKYSGASFGVGVSSGTDALLVAMMALNVGPGDEVITSPYTFFASASTVARLGAKPVFVDIDPITYNINSEEIESKISSRTKAIIPVHLYGQCAQMDKIMGIAKKHGLAVIEDACQAIGSEHKGERAGSIGTMGCFSFFPSKNLGGFGDAGMVTTNDQGLSDLLKALRMHGSVKQYYHHYLGGNFRLDALQAGILRVKLKHLEAWAQKRRQNADFYRKAFFDAGIIGDYASYNQGKSFVCLPSDASDGRHIYNQFVIRAKRRDELMKYLQDRKVGCQIYYPLSLHLQPCFEYLGGKVGDFPESEKASKETLALPIYPELSNEQLSYVVTTIKSFYS